jgi:hypothetical protein
VLAGRRHSTMEMCGAIGLGAGTLFMDPILVGERTGVRVDALVDSSSPRWNSVALHATLWNERWRVQRTHRQRRAPKNSRAKRRPDPTETCGTRIRVRIRIRKRQRAERERRRKNGGIRIRIRRRKSGRKKTAEKNGGEGKPE